MPLLLALLPQTALLAQVPAPGQTPPVRLEIVSANETRSDAPPIGSQLVLVVQPATGPTSTETRLWSLTVNRAIDDRGRLLSLASAKRIPASSSTSANTAMIGLIDVPRSAKQIALIEGTAEMVTPTEANGGLIRIADIQSHAGRIEHPALSQAGISLQFIAEQEAWLEATARIRNVGVVARGTAGVRLPVAPRGGSFSTVPVWPGNGQKIGLIFNDPSEYLMKVWLQDGAGRILASFASSARPAVGGSVGPIAMLLDLSAPLAPDTELIVTLAVPAAVKTMPFRLENIPLY